MSDPGVRRELTSWKEVAEYLSVTVRTAQKWEAMRGLPIRRLPGGRSRVAAYIDEIDGWKQTVKIGLDVELRSLPRRPRWILVAAIIIGVATLSVGAMFFGRAAVASRPGSFRVDSNNLYVYDQFGRELFRRHFDIPLAVEDYIPRTSSALERRQLRFVDLDNDGRIEILFHHAATPVERGPSLYCFNDHGAVLWNYRPGKAVSAGGTEFESTYQLRQFTVARLDRAGAKAIVVTSSHLFYYPNQVTLLSPQGRVLREYWHSGALLQVETTDYNRDGVDEVYLSGINNARRRATIVVLDPRTMAGASVEDRDEYQLSGFAPGVELARLFLERTELNRLSAPYNTPLTLGLFPDKIVLQVIEYPDPPTPRHIEYEFNPDLTLREIVWNDYTASLHERLQREGNLTVSVRQETERLKAGLRIIRGPAPLSNRLSSY